MHQSVQLRTFRKSLLSPGENVGELVCVKRKGTDIKPSKIVPVNYLTVTLSIEAI